MGHFDLLLAPKAMTDVLLRGLLPAVCPLTHHTVSVPPFKIEGVPVLLSGKSLLLRVWIVSC